MSLVNSETLEGYFNTGDKPTEAQFQSLIESLMPQTPGGRLTLTTGVPVTTAEVTAATTVYYCPYVHNMIRLYDGSNWKLYQFTERSISVPASTSQMYDVFLYDNAGTLTLELVAWTNDSTRATTLTYQDGVLVKSGDATRRYLGSFRTTTVSGQTEDSLSNRYLWNYYNRVSKHLRVQNSTGHTYGTGAWRYWNNDSANSVAFVLGVVEDPISFTLNTQISGNASQAIVGVGVNTTTGYAYSDVRSDHNDITKFGSSVHHPVYLLPIGRSYLAISEYATGATMTFTSAYMTAKIIG